MSNNVCAGTSPGDRDSSSINALYAAIDSSWKAFAAYWYGREGLRRRMAER